MRSKLALLPLFALLAACSSKPHTSQPQPPAELIAPKGGFLLEPAHAVQPMFGDFASNPVAEQFIDKMVAKHGFDRQQLHAIIGQAKRLDYVLRLMDRQAPSYTPPSGPNGAWIRYSDKFITPDNVQNGVAFWNQYQDALQRAQRSMAFRRKLSSALLASKRAGAVLWAKPVFWMHWLRSPLIIHAVLPISAANWKPFC